MRLKLQILLIAGGYNVAVPTDKFSWRIFSALKTFEAENGFVPSSHLNKDQIDRLLSIGSERLNYWGFRKLVS